MDHRSRSHVIPVSPRLPAPSHAARHIHGAVLHDIGLIHAVDHLAGSATGALKTKEQREKGRGYIDTAKDAGDATERFSKGLNKASEVSNLAQKLELYRVAVGQSTRDVVKLKLNFHVARLAAEAGSSAAAAAQSFMRPMISEMDHALHQDRLLVEQYRDLLRDARSEALSGIGHKNFAAIEAMLAKSEIGRHILKYNKIPEKIKLGKWMAGVGAASAAWKAYDQGEGISTRGRLVHAAMAGGTDYLIGKSSAVGLIDLGLKYGGKAVGADDKDVEGILIGTWAQGTMNQFYGLGRAIWLRDTKPLDELHRQNMSGENGRVLQGYAMLGVELADYDVIDHARRVKIAFHQQVDPAISRSLAWWSSL